MANITPFLRLMVKKGASDMFLSVGARPEIKVEGKSIPVGRKKLDSNAMQSIIRSILDEQQQSIFAVALEHNASFSAPSIGRFRVYAYRQRGEVALVLRYIKHEVPSFEVLGLPPILADLIMEKRGLILVVGATGSGKSTTLAAMIDHRNINATGHILTVEDPIEFIHRHKRSLVDQREVGIDALSYEDALKNALRGAPDLIMIGEVRDAATMQHAMHFSETGHLCLATLHATNASQAIERAINFFPEDAKRRLLLDLSLQLKAIVAQRLIPGVDGRRVPAVELMLNTPYISDLIEKGKIGTIKEVLEKRTEETVQTFDHAVFELWKTGKISPREALRYADSSNDVRMRIEFERPGTFSHIDPEELSIHDD
jgi:twitching motility protein PilU